MLTNQLAQSSTGATESDKNAVSAKLAQMLPKDSFTVLLRSSSSSDFRARSTGQPKYRLVIMLTNVGRQAVQDKRDAFLAAGFTVEKDGSLSLVNNKN
jgi:hypothetical protein